MNDYYKKTVALLLDITPYVFKDNTFALKGGTAINLFYDNMPRLSVDLDLVSVNYSDNRNVALKSISDTLLEVKNRLVSKSFIVEEIKAQEANLSKLLVKRGNYQVKLEVNYVMRGTLLPVEKKYTSQGVDDYFKMEAEATLLSKNEVYAGKVLAALDRQHPRDLYDIHRLYLMGGLNKELLECFVCYLCCHDRVFGDVLNPNDKDISKEYENQFKGMTFEDIALDTLLETRKKLKFEILQMLSITQKEFLISFADVKPKWELMPFDHLKDLPAIRWKLLNLENLKSQDASKFKKQLKDLENLF